MNWPTPKCMSYTERHLNLWWTMHAACNVTIKNTSKLVFRTLFQELGKNSHFPCLKGKLAIKIFFSKTKKSYALNSMKKLVWYYLWKNNATKLKENN